jgi:hypothetical protein
MSKSPEQAREIEAEVEFERLREACKQEKTPLDNKEKRDLLKPELLAKLSTEEYISLWTRLNPYYLSHVTRQGFRDHVGTMYHSAGSQQFHEGLVSVLEDDKKLRPPIALDKGLKSRDTESIKRFLEMGVLTEENEEAAKKRLNQELNFSMATAPNYPDETAVHFAAEVVGDKYYGGESDNEVFFLYPSDVLASQHDFTFNGAQKDLTRAQSEMAWNDVFVWPESVDDTGIDLDAGMVFLPKDTLVDLETGSKYASERKKTDGQEVREMIEDGELVTKYTDWAKGIDDPDSELNQAIQEYRSDMSSSAFSKKRECLKVMKAEMLELGFSDDAALDIADATLSAMASMGKFYWRDDMTIEEVAGDLVRKSGAHWKRAEETVTASEYWEDYFSKNPKKKPAHVVYYSGSPTTAVQGFLKEHQIGTADQSETEGQLLGFDDRHVTDMKNDPRANAGYDKLVEVAHQIIEEHYASQDFEPPPDTDE